ncbi:MAG: hypothetical protein PUB98_01585 [Clostridiales bacterium]|nr:hypothetical protein [Clostridiales bacterium]
MKEAFISVLANFKSFLGSGWLMWVVFCVALIGCCLLGKEKRKLFTVSVMLCLMILNPITYQVVGEKFLSGVYWRLFWTLPIVTAVAVVLTELAGRWKKEWMRFLTVGAFCIVIALLGKSVINRGTYTVAANDYQLPQEVIAISDRILQETEGETVRVLMPDALVCYVRQYTTKITLAYGRDIWGFIAPPEAWEQELYQLAHDENIDYGRLCETALRYGCRFAVFDTEAAELPRDMERQGYTYVGAVEQYRIYALDYTAICAVGVIK